MTREGWSCRAHRPGARDRADGRELAAHVCAAARRSGIAAALEEEGPRRRRPRPAGVRAADRRGRRRAAGAEIVVVSRRRRHLPAGRRARPPHRRPLLGVNLGRVGFLAEAEPEAVDGDARRDRARRLLGRGAADPRRRRRPTRDGDVDRRHWALNEVSGREGDARAHARGRPRHRRPAAVHASAATACCARPPPARPPTRSPPAARWSGRDVEALLLVPINAHALFARPLVTSPTRCSPSTVARPGTTPPVLVLRRSARRSTLPPGAPRRASRRAARPVRLARGCTPPRSATALVAKFGLPGATAGAAPGPRLPPDRDAAGATVADRRRWPRPCSRSCGSAGSASSTTPRSSSAAG